MLSQNFLETEGLKPKADEIEKAELAVNLADKIIYTKDHTGAVVSVGGNSDVTCTVPVVTKDITIKAGSKCMMISPEIADGHTITIEDTAILVIL